jgi:predicted DNA-binding transcriptional regulator AlpA
VGKLIDQDEAAGRLGISPRTLANWRYRREGPPYRKVGRSVRYDEDDLRTWAEGTEVIPEGGDAEQVS